MLPMIATATAAMMIRPITSACAFEEQFGSLLAQMTKASAVCGSLSQPGLSVSPARWRRRL
jgi:hypothetical protein